MEKSRARATRRRLGLLVVAALLAACGDDGDDVDAAETATGAPEGATCDETDPVRVGMLFPMSGPAAVIGERSVDGAEVARDEINENGGVLGRCIELVLEDDRSEPTRAAQAARKLVEEEEVHAVLGPTQSTPLGATLEITRAAGVVQVTSATLPAAGDASQNPQLFRVELSADFYGQTYVDFALAGGYSRIGVLATNDAFGTSVTESIELAAEGTPVEVVAVEFHESGQPNLTAHLGAVLEAEPDLLVFVSVGADVIAALNARATLAPELRVLAPSATATAAVVDAVTNPDGVLAGQYPRGLARSGPDGKLAEKTEEFRKRYKQQLGVDDLGNVDLLHAAGVYDSLHLFASAANAAGSLELDAVRAALEREGYDGVKASFEYSSDRHDGMDPDDVWFVEIGTLSDGTFALAELP